MTLITFQENKPLMKDDGTIGAEQACCRLCGEDCPQIVTVNFSVGLAEGQLVYGVADGSLDDFFESDEYQLSSSSVIFCSVVDGCVQWTLTLSLCYLDLENDISEDYEGLIEADSNGCPKTGNVTMNLTFGDDESTVTASIA